MSSISSSRLDSPQIVRFDDLLTKYHYKNIFDHEIVGKITTIFERVMPKLEIGNYPKFDDSYNAYRNRNYENIPHQFVCLDSSWIINSIATGRSHLGIHQEFDSLVFKFFIIEPARGNPMSTSLRAPMGDLMRKIIVEHSLDKIEVPLEGIIPIFSVEIIKQLDEWWINNALVTVAEKKEFITQKAKFDIVKAYGQNEQLNLANQICKLISETGAGDLIWNNILMTPEKKLLILDTEPLRAELNIDRNDVGFEKSAAFAKLYTLRKSAIVGLTAFAESSANVGLERFEEVAKKKIEELTEF